MKILAVEFSSARRSVAVLAETSEGAAAGLLGAVSQCDGRAALGLVEEALGQANSSREEIGVIAVGLGPGSYTGVRAAIALAQGWQLGRGVKLIGISSVECVAAQAHAAGRRGRIYIMIDAQRNEFYLAGYEMEERGWREVEPLRLAAFSEVETPAKAARLIGPGASALIRGAQDVFPEAAVLGRLARGRDNFVAGEKLEPIYLRETAFKKAPAPRLIP